MRDFSKVSPRVWQSGRFRRLESDDARYLYLYLLTCVHNNSAGAFRLPSAYAAADLSWPPERLVTALRALQTGSMIECDETTEEVFVLRWFRHNPPTNQKHRKGIERLISDLDSDRVREAAEIELTDFAEHSAPPSTQRTGGSDLMNTGFMRGGRQ